MVGKLRHISKRFLFGISDLPKRFKRFFLHFLWWFPFRPEKDQYIIIKNPIEWLAAIPFYILDICLIPEFYEAVFEMAKWNIRYLTRDEHAVVGAIFKNSIDSGRIRLDEKAIMGPKQRNFAYVSFQTINSYGKMSKPILIHECVHVWQFLKFGSVYIMKALLAQHSKQGYDYGSVPGLLQMQADAKKFCAFNFEQQGDIVMDYFKLLNRPPELVNEKILDLYRTFVYDLFKDSQKDVA